MNRHLLLLLLPILPLLARAEDVIPQSTGPDRYKAIWERSPFTVASADEAPKATWVLAGLTESDSDPVLYVLNKDTQERMVVTREPNAKGFSLVSIRYDASPLRSSALVKAPGEPQPITLRFDADLLVVNNPGPAAAKAGEAAAATAPAAEAGGGEDRPWRRRNRRVAVPNPTASPSAAAAAATAAPAPASGGPAAAPAAPAPQTPPSNTNPDPFAP